jgi:hypothetical protein
MIVATPAGRLEIITNLMGRHNVYNVLAAVAVGVLLNLPLEDVGAGIESVQFVPGRWVALCTFCSRLALASVACQLQLARLFALAALAHLQSLCLWSIQGHTTHSLTSTWQ